MGGAEQEGSDTQALKKRVFWGSLGFGLDRLTLKFMIRLLQHAEVSPFFQAKGIRCLTETTKFR
jgi:hypothetical protein